MRILLRYRYCAARTTDKLAGRGRQPAGPQATGPWGHESRGRGRIVEPAVLEGEGGLRRGKDKFVFFLLVLAGVNTAFCQRLKKKKTCQKSSQTF